MAHPGVCNGKCHSHVTFPVTNSWMRHWSQHDQLGQAAIADMYTEWRTESRQDFWTPRTAPSLIGWHTVRLWAVITTCGVQAQIQRTQAVGCWRKSRSVHRYVTWFIRLQSSLRKRSSVGQDFWRLIPGWDLLLLYCGLALLSRGLNFHRLTLILYIP